MNDSNSGCTGTPSATGSLIADFDTVADRRTYEAALVARVDGRAQLVAPSHRKRQFPVVMEVSDELLLQILEERGITLGSSEELATTRAQLAIVTERNERQSKTIQQQATEMRRAQEERLQRARERSDELAEVREERDSLRGDLHQLRDRFNAESEKAARYLKRANALLASIQKVLHSTDAAALWKTAHTAFRNGLVRNGYHARGNHPWWSRHFWVGCPTCVPDWLLYSATELSNGEASPSQHVVDALARATAAILQPVSLEPDVLTAAVSTDRTL